MKLLQSEPAFCAWFAATMQRQFQLTTLHLAESQATRLKNLVLPKVFVHQLKLSSLSQIPLTLKYSNTSIESEFKTIHALNDAAKLNGNNHQIMLACDAGDKREGLNPEEVLDHCEKINGLSHISLRGIATNFGCFSGYIPDDKTMQHMLRWMNNLREKLNRPDLIYSLGNTSSLPWLLKEAKLFTDPTEIRLGESLFLGLESTSQTKISELYTDAFSLCVEVLESKFKSNLPPNHKFGPNGFKETPANFPSGSSQRLLLGLGRQDCDFRGLIAPDGLQILGSSSDYMVAIDHQNQWKSGDTIRFQPDYRALMGLFRSPEVQKNFNYPQES